MKNHCLLICLALFCGVLFSTCKDTDPTIAQITVLDKNNSPVSGAKVRVYCSPSPCNNAGGTGESEDIQTSDASGMTTHEFKLPAVLKIMATKDTLIGEGYVELVEHETVQQTVIIL